MLDRSKPFGTIHGPDAKAAFYQDGKYFDHDGYECTWPDGTRTEKKEAPAPKAKGAPPPQADDNPEEEDIVVGDVNLSAFARGELTDVSASKIKKAVEEYYGRKPKDLTEALAIVKGEEVD